MMLKLIGVMLLVCATGYTGLSMSASLKERIRAGTDKKNGG